MKDTVFIYWGYHFAHVAWAESVTKDIHPFIANRYISDNIRSPYFPKHKILFSLLNMPLVHQTLSSICSKNIPQAKVYIIEGIGCILPAMLRKKAGSKIIMINDDPFFDIFKEQKGIKKKIYKRLLKNIDGIISTSKFMDSKIPFKNTPRKVAPLFVDVNRFSRIKPDLNSKIISYIGRLDTCKGSDILFKVFSKIHDYDKEYKLDIIGSLWDKQTIKEFSSIKKRYPKSVSTTRWTKHPEKQLKHCSDYINAARIEPFGINILESMCAGIPPIVTDRCGTAEFVAKASPKLITDPNANSIYDAFLWLNENQKRKRSLAAKCRKIASQFTKDKSITQFKKSLDSMLG